MKMQNHERFASWDEVDALREAVRAYVGVKQLIYGEDELRKALDELSKLETFRELVPFVLRPQWNDPTEKKLFFLSRVDRQAVIEAMANAMDRD